MKKQTTNQSTMAPTRKQRFVAQGAVVATLITALMHASGYPFLLKFIGYPGVEAAIGGGLAWLFGYMAKEYVR